MPRKITKLLSILVCFCLLFEQTGFAQVAGVLDISGHIAAFRNSLIQDKFRPLHLRSLGYDNIQNNFRLLLDKGDLKSPKKPDLEITTKTLLNYFFIGVTLPNDTFWVNLRPDSENNIIDSDLATTDVGKILLEADLQLKKDTAKFTSPETPEGKEYWEKLYQKAGELLGYENITIPTLTRPWIVPGEIIIRETKDNAYIYKATLKVMLEQDYLKDSATYNFDDPRLKTLNEYSSQLIRDLIIPKLTKEVNTSQRYAPLRQVYYSLILAQWFKSRFYGKGGLYSWLIDRRGLQGLTSKTPWSKTTYFKAYQKSFKDGEYNIQQPTYTPYGQTIRSYFSGGFVCNVPMPAIPAPGVATERTEGPTKVIAISGDAEHSPLPRTESIVGALAVGGNTMDPSETRVTITEEAPPSGLPAGGSQSGASSTLVHLEIKNFLREEIGNLANQGNNALETSLYQLGDGIGRYLYSEYGLIVPDLYTTEGNTPIVVNGNEVLFFGMPIARITRTAGRAQIIWTLNKESDPKGKQISRLTELLIGYEKQSLQKVIEAAFNLARQLHERGVGTIIISGGSAILLYRMLNEAFSKLYPGETPSIFALSADTNDKIFVEKDSKSARSLIEKDLGVPFSQLKGPIFYVDEYIRTKTKLRNFNAAFQSLPIEFTAVVILGESEQGLVVGSNDRSVYNYLSFLSERISDVIRGKNGVASVSSKLTKLGVSEANAQQFEDTLPVILSEKLVEIAEVIKQQPASSSPIQVKSANQSNKTNLGAQVANVKHLDRLLRILNVLRKGENVPGVSESASDREILEFCIKYLEAKNLIVTKTDTDGNIIIVINSNTVNHPDETVRRFIDVIRKWVINPEEGIKAVNFQNKNGAWIILGFESELQNKDILEHEQKEIKYRKQGLSWIDAHIQVVRETGKGGGSIDKAKAEAYKAGRQDEIGAAGKNASKYIAPGTRKIGDGYTLEIKLPSDGEKYILEKEKRRKFIDYLHETTGLIDEKSTELKTTYREAKEIIDILLKAAGLNPDYFIFHFVDSLEPNAFVLRYSNHIFVNVGLIDYLISKGGTKDALAFVLAHEITHLVQFRSDIDAGKAHLPEDLKDVAETYVVSYGDEYDADWRALKLLERVYEMTNGQVHFSISQATFLFNRLNEDLQEDARRHPDRSEWDRLKTKFGTHPQLKERIRNLEKIMNSLYWRSYFIQPSPFSDALTKEVQKKTRTQRLRQDIKDMHTITDFKDLLSRVTNLDELEFLVIATYEKTKNHGVNFSFRDAFDLADNKADDLIRGTPELLPYYFFIFTSLARFTGYTRIDYDKHKQAVKEKLQGLTFEQLRDLLKIQLPPILATNTETEYFEYKYTFYGLTGSNDRGSRQTRFENFMEIWIDALMEEIEQRVENRPLSIQEVFDLESALEMHRQRGKQVRPTLMETWRQYFPGNRALFHVYNFDITWYLWNRIKEDPQGNREYIQKFIDRLNVLALSQGGGFGGGYRQEALTMSGSIRANRYQEMLDGLRQLMEQGLVTKEQYLNFVINKGGKYSKELASEYRRKEIDNFPQGNLLTFTGTDIDRDFEVFMRMFSSAEEYFSKDMMDKLVAYYGLSTTDRLDFIERSYKKINAAWFAQGTETKKVIDEDEEGSAEPVEQEDAGKKTSGKQESLYFLSGFHDYLRNAVFSLKQTPETEEFLTKKMRAIEREKHLSGLSSLSFQMKRLIYLYHIGSGIHPWTLKLLLFGRDEDNGYMLTTYAIDFSAVREAEGVALREKEMGRDLGFGETSKLRAKEQQAKTYGRRNADKIEELIRGGARFWDKEETLLQLTPEQLAKMPKGTVLKSIRAEQGGDYNYVTVGEDQFRQDAKRKTYIWYDTFAGVPVDPFLYEYSDSSKAEEEKGRGYGIAGARRIDAHPLYGVQFSNQDLEGFYRYLSALPTKQGLGKFPSMEDFDARNVFHEIGDIDTWDEYIAAIGIQSFLRRQGVNTVNRGLQPRVFDAGEYDKVPSYYKAFVGELFELPGLEGIGFWGFRSHGKMAEQYRQYHGEGPTPHVLLRQHFNDGPVDEMFKEAFGFINELKGSLSEKVDYLIKGLPPSVFRNFALYALFLNDVFQVVLKNKGKSNSFDMRKALEPKYIDNFIKSNFSFDEQMSMLSQAELIMRHIVWDKRLDAANRKNLVESAEKAVRGERLITHDEELARERNAEREAASSRGGSNRDNPEYVYVPENFSSTGYTPYQYYVAGGVEAHIEFILLHMFSGTLEVMFKDKTLSVEEKIRHFKNLYPRTSQLSDQHLDNILTNTQLQPEEIKKLLPLFSNEALRQKYALKALELERDLYNGRFDDADYELERILYYFPEFGYTRDDILNDFINRKVTNPKQLKQVQAYLLQFEDNVRRQEARNRIFGRDIFKTIFEDYAFGEEQKKEFLLWVLGFTDKKPDFLIILEHDYHINFDSMRSGTVISDTKYYKDIGRSAFEDVLSSFLFGEKGILTNEETRSSFLTTIFNSMVRDMQGRREGIELAREIFLSVFDHASEVRQEQLLKRLFVSMKKTVSGKKLSAKELEAKGIRVFLESIGFAGVKLGQFIQSAFELPEHISSELQKLKEEAELLPKGVAFQVLDSVFGDFYEVFDSLDEVIGRASLKVVYRARLKDGRQVVVKLKRPDVEKRIEEEMKLMSDVLSSVERNLRQQGIVLPQNMIPRIREMIESELDFNREYANQGELRENIKAREAKEAASRSQPKGIGGLISKFVTPSKYSIKIPNSTEVKNNMVMIEEEVKGFSLDKTDELVKSGVDPKEAKAAALEELLKEIFIDGFYHADPHAGNILVSSGYQMSFIDLGLMGRLSPENQKIIFKLILYANKNSIRHIPFLASVLGIGSAQDIVNLLQQIAGGHATGISTRKVESIAASSDNTAEKLLKYFRLIEDSGAELPAEFIILSKTLGTAGYLFHDMSLTSIGRVLISIMNYMNTPKQKPPSSSPIDGSFEGGVGKMNVVTFDDAWQGGTKVEISQEHLGVLQDPSMGPAFITPEVRLISIKGMNSIAPGAKVVRVGNQVLAISDHWGSLSDNEKLDVLMHEGMADWLEREHPGVSPEDTAIDLEGLKRNEAERRARHKVESQQEEVTNERSNDLPISNDAEASSSPTVKARTPGSQADKKGGIDFRVLPIVNQPINTAMLKLSAADLNRLSNINLNAEWAEIQNMINSGIIPSNERIKQYVLASYLRQSLGNQMDKVLGCIADIMRMEEDRIADTEPELRDMLVLLESGRPQGGLSNDLSRINFSPKEPKLIPQ